MHAFALQHCITFFARRFSKFDGPPQLDIIGISFLFLNKIEKWMPTVGRGHRKKRKRSHTRLPVGIEIDPVAGGREFCQKLNRTCFFRSYFT